MSLIILSSHGQSGLTGWNVGSVVQKIVMRARTFILIVHAFSVIRRSRYRRLLVPMDGSHHRRMGLAPGHDSGSGAREPISCWPTWSSRRRCPAACPPTAEDVELADRVVKRNTEEARRYVEELSAWMPASVRGAFMVGEHVPATLHQLADEEGVDLVVLSAHGYSGGTRFPYGGVVTSFITYGSTPVLIVQDLPADEIQPNPAEMRATDRGALPMPHGTFDVEDSWQPSQLPVPPIWN